MGIRFCLLIVLLISLICLSVSDKLPRSEPSYGRTNHYFPASKHGHEHCHYSNPHQSPFANDSSICVNSPSENSGGIQYHTLDKYANDFRQAMLSIPDLERFLQLNIPVNTSKRLFYKLDYELLKEVGYPKPKHPAKAVAESLAMYDDFPLAIYFKVLGYTIGRFLLAENIELGHNSVRCYSYLVEVAMQANCIDSVKELYEALLDSFVNFTKSLGFTFLEKSDLLFRLFTKELLKFAENHSHPHTHKHKDDLHHN